MRSGVHSLFTNRLVSWFDKQRSQVKPTKKSFFTNLVVLVSNRGSMFELFVVTVQSLWNRKNKCGLILLNEACFPLDKLSDITKSNKAGIGIVVCDSQGEVLVVLSNQKTKKKGPYVPTYFCGNFGGLSRKKGSPVSPRDLHQPFHL